jgi:queuine tRNA-ribosyltransferase
MSRAVTLSILARSQRFSARLGRVRTPHGEFDTPAFMPVGTRASVKGVLPSQLANLGAQVCLANTYHLLLRPGSDLVEKMGGLHAFMNWNRPILTDSGGYQAYSMADINKVTDDGVSFRSIIDGSMIHLSPERAIHVQNQLGADIIMAFDDCPPSAPDTDADAPPIDPGSALANDPRLSRVLSRDKVKDPADHARRLREACERSVRWLHRCKAAHARTQDQALFGIVQGGTDLAQRSWSAEHTCAIDLPGYAIGGVAVGETSDDIARVVKHTAPLLPADRPRYLIGVGYERDLLAAVLSGVDMFDCVLPTRNGRNANAFTRTGQIRLRNSKYALDRSPIEPGCDCIACAGDPSGPEPRPFTRGYLRHLFHTGEMLGPMLVTLHNLRHFQRFMSDVRATIPTDDWEGLLTRWPIARPGYEAVGG